MGRRAWEGRLNKRRRKGDMVEVGGWKRTWVIGGAGQHGEMNVKGRTRKGRDGIGKARGDRCVISCLRFWGRHVCVRSEDERGVC